MLTEICAYLRNYFDRGQPKYYGRFSVENGELIPANGEDLGLQQGQYYRIVGSVFNDGVWKYGTDTLSDENWFTGSVWLMAVPPELESIAEDVSSWLEKNGAVDSENMSPFSSESFSGYSYTKAQGYASVGGGMLNGWQSVYGQRLNRWKKL